jgi:cell division septation protein DedD
MNIKSIFLIILSFLLYSCSSTETTIQQDKAKEPEVYVFDDVSKTDSSKIIPTKTIVPVTEKQEKISVAQPIIGKKFIVQVGAYTSKDRAEAFVKENQSKTDQKMSISFSNQVQLYVIQLPPFSSREEAEKVRNSLWLITPFKGSFIITSEEQK